MHAPYVIAERFFDGAEELRAAFEAHFQNPDKHTAQHQVWNYWYVPDSYTYLRTSPSKIMPEPLIQRFLARINGWAIETLGLSTRHHPWLSLYVDGCGQTIHNDSRNGQMGYVYSITRWDERTFQGGETLLFRPENYWETDRILHSGAGTSFYEKVPSRFNQLLVFDDRVIHGVQPILGTMDPLAGRVVIHGHLSAEAVALSGSLNQEAAVSALSQLREQVLAATRPYGRLLHGFMTLRLTLHPDGRVAAVRRLCDRILPLTPDRSRVESFKHEIEELISATRFPAAVGPSAITLPVLVGP